MTVDQKNQAIVIDHVQKEIESDRDTMEFQFTKLLTDFESKFPFLKVDGLTLIRVSTLTNGNDKLGCEISISLSLKDKSNKANA